MFHPYLVTSQKQKKIVSLSDPGPSVALWFESEKNNRKDTQLISWVAPYLL